MFNGPVFEIIVVVSKNGYVNYKSKYQRDRRPDKETWVFGIADTSTNPAVTYMQTVAKRDAATLLPIIQKVYSDEWCAYRQIQPSLGLQHETVNHSVNFVDPSTGVHTQSKESYWAKTKYKFKVMKDPTLYHLT